MEMQKIIDKCGKITKSKGFDSKQYLKQILLIADECIEATDHIAIGSGTHSALLELYYNVYANFKIYKNYRKNMELPEETNILNREKLAEELADIVIRVFSFCSLNDIDLENAIIEKMKVNQLRPALHGQKF